MPTRRQDPETREFRQNAFASSVEHERGILGNLVAARCHKLTDSEEIAVLWWLQQVSWRDGGLEKFAREFLGAHGTSDDDFAIGHEALANTLRNALVDPASRSLRMGVAGVHGIWDALIAWRSREIEAAKARIVETAITKQIGDELDFALETRSFVLIEGREGIGKSEGARAWCDQRPGRAIYVRLECGSDETTLFRSIARRIGTACSYQRKPVEMRLRIQDVFQTGHLALVLDEAHFAWPQSERAHRSPPKRMDWIRTALVDFGVPVVLIGTPQYFEQQCERHRKAGWNANQVQRRLTRTVRLPENVSPDDAIAVGRSYFPDVPQRLLKRAAGVALLDVARLTMFSHLKKRVDFLASRRPGASRTELLEYALAEIDAPGASVCNDRAAHVASPFQAPRRGSAEVPIAEPPKNRLSVSIQQFEASGV